MANESNPPGVPPQEAPRSPAARAAERAARPDFNPQFTDREDPATGREPKGHPGGLIRHLLDLAGALQNRQWSEALGYFREVIEIVQTDLSGAPAAPMFSADMAGAGADQVAERIRRFCADHGERANRPGVGFVIPWLELLPLLKLIFDVLLSKRA